MPSLKDYVTSIQEAATRYYEGKKPPARIGLEQVVGIAEHLKSDNERVAFGLFLYAGLNKPHQAEGRLAVSGWLKDFLKKARDKTSLYREFGDVTSFSDIGTQLHAIDPDIFREFAQANPLEYKVLSQSKDFKLPRDIPIDQKDMDTALKNYRNSGMFKILGYDPFLLSLTPDPSIKQEIIEDLLKTDSGKRKMLDYYLSRKEELTSDENGKLSVLFRETTGYSDSIPQSGPAGSAKINVPLLQKHGASLIGQEKVDHFLIGTAKADPAFGIKLAVEDYPYNPKAIEFYQAALPRSLELLKDESHRRLLVSMLNKLEPSQYAGQNVRLIPEKDVFRLLDGANASQLFELLTLAPKDNSYAYTQGTYNAIFERFGTQLKSEKKTLSEIAELSGDKEKKIEALFQIADAYSRIGDLVGLTKPEDRLSLAPMIMRESRNGQGYNFSLITSFMKALPRHDLSFPVLESIMIQKTANGDLYTKADIGVIARWYADNRPNDISPDHKAFFDAVKADPSFAVKPLNTLPAKDLIDGQGRNFQLHVFYNDKDGIDTFNSVTTALKASGFAQRKVDDFLVFSKNQNGREIQMLLSPPERDGKDIKKLQDYIADQGGKFSVVVARGHSHHMSDAIGYLDQQTRIVTLGGCWGHQYTRDVLAVSPDAHIMATKGVGRMAINNINMNWLNEQILAGKDVNWADLRAKWDKLKPDGKKIETDVKQYVAPDENLFLLYERKRNELYGQIDRRSGNQIGEDFMRSVREIVDPALPAVTPVSQAAPPRTVSALPRMDLQYSA